MTTTDVLISGAGIAGPALAYWLHEHGHDVTVVERARAPRPGGQTVDLRGAGRTVVTRMGLMERVRAVTVDECGLAMVGRRGHVTATLPADALGGEGIVSEIEVLRGDLAAVLHTATAATTEYLFDDTITGLDQDADGVTVTFESTTTRRFGLVVGADGLHSAVRRLAFAPDAECVRPLGCHTAWFTAPADDSLDGWLMMHNAVGGRVASLRPGRLPDETKAGLSFRAGPLAVDRRDPTALRDEFARRFAGLGWKVPWLLEAMWAAPDLAYDAVGQVHLPRWSRGRVALLGDAGYCPSPLTGLGTSLALVGAYVLAGEIAAADGDHGAAFDRYESVLRPYVTKGQELPPLGVRGFAPGSRFEIAMTHASMRSMTRWPIRAIAARQFAKAGDVVLPDYGAVTGPVTPDGRDRATARARARRRPRCRGSRRPGPARCG